jgi:hypothetical protein
VAEGGGLLNRYRVVKPYRGFESLRLRQYSFIFKYIKRYFGPLPKLDLPTKIGQPTSPILYTL